MHYNIYKNGKKTYVAETLKEAKETVVLLRKTFPYSNIECYNADGKKED